MKILLEFLLFCVMVYMLVHASLKLKKFGLSFLILGLYFLWKAFNSYIVPKLFNYEKFEDYEILKTDGFVCKLKDKQNNVEKSGCLYKDIGCISPVPKEGCPPTFNEYKEKLKINPGGECDKSILFRKLKKLKNEELTNYVKGKTELQIQYPVNNCLDGIDETSKLNEKIEVLKLHYKEFLESQKTNGNTDISEYSKTINTEYNSILNDSMKDVYREVYKQYFSNTVDNSVSMLEETRLNATSVPGVTPITRNISPSGSFSKDKNGYIIIGDDKKYNDIYDLKEAVKDKVSEEVKARDQIRIKRQELINKCNRYICNKSQQHIQAYEEIGEKVEDLDWWKATSQNR